jgi:hypothetical protein
MPLKKYSPLVAFPLLAAPLTGLADGVVIDKIYHPYVQPLEQELEWRSIHQDEQPGTADNKQLHRLAYGRSLSDRLFTEFYLIAEKSADESFKLEAYEIEALWQLSEQGEFWADWGALFELEKEHEEDVWEAAGGLLVEKEWGRWSTTANLFVAYEWGSDIEDELESTLGLQARYRYSRALEPAVEYYQGEETKAMGPVLLGQVNLGARRQVKWEAGAIFGLDNESPNRTLRFLVEFEF